MLEFVDESLRDGPQSLWATRMRTESMLAVAPLLDKVGFSKACVASGASFETAVKFLHESPWERVQLLSAAMPDTPIDILIRSRNLFGWERYPNEVIDLLFRCLKRAGASSVKIFDGLNDIDNIAAAFPIALANGLQPAGLLAFSLSPVHTDAHFAKKAREFVTAGATSIIITDASGLMSGERARQLIAAVKEAVAGAVPLEFLAHHTMGLAHESYREALKAGIRKVATACTPLANGESLPGTLDILSIAQELGIATNLDEEALRRADDLLHWVAYKEGHSLAEPVRFDPVHFQSFAGHQIPGGMISNFRRQLAELGLMHRLDEVLEEAARVRLELGCPIMVTPFSQFVGVQATFNIIQGERYRTVPRELMLYALGHYGKSPGPIDPDVLDRILKGRNPDAVDVKLDVDAAVLADFRKIHGPFASDEELLLHMFYGADPVETMKRNKTIISGLPSVDKPLTALVRELSCHRGFHRFSLEHRDVRITMTQQEDVQYERRMA